jgi:hypothetical protein
MNAPAEVLTLMCPCSSRNDVGHVQRAKGLAENENLLFRARARTCAVARDRVAAAHFELRMRSTVSLGSL